MTYREFLSDFAPDREDVGFGVAAAAAVLAVGLSVGVPLSFAYGSFEPIIALFTIFGGMIAASTVVYFVATFTYWAIVERNEEY
jgi:hypothetical protein